MRWCNFGDSAGDDMRSGALDLLGRFASTDDGDI